MRKVALCPIEEFHANEDNRVDESALTIGGLYTVMFSLRGPLPFSLRFSSRVENLSGDSFDSRQISIFGLDLDLKPYKPIITANINDGIMDFRGLKNPMMNLPYDTDGPERPTQLDTGFFLDYEEPFGMDQKLREALGMSVGLTTIVPVSV